LLPIGFSDVWQGKREYQPVELVYFLSANHTSLVKIGWTANIVQRLQKLRLSCPHDVRLIGVRPGTRDLEAAYHLHFSSQREHAEWFRFEYETITWMEIALRAQYSEAWEEVERLFAEQAPDLLKIKGRWGGETSILTLEFFPIDETPARKKRRPSNQPAAGGAE
jgi:hypothetical protein